MKRLFTLLLISFAALSCEMIDEKLDDFLGRDDSSVTTIANNQIWYTSTDGEIVEPHSDWINNYADAITTFGVNIVSNTYKDGKGVIEFDGDVTTIGDSAFEYCSSLISVTIPDSVTTIGEDAFYGCSSLTSVTIPDSVTTIGDYAFDECYDLTSVTIGDSVTTIGYGAFAWCANLASINIPDSATTIGECAFYNCSSLTSVTIPNSVITIGDKAFTGCNGLKEFKGKFASEDGRCLIIDGVLNSFAPAGLTEYTIPDSVTTIGENAFYSCSSLTSVTIPDSVTTIGENAFYQCSSLTSVYCKPTTPPTTIVDYNGYWCAFDENASARKIYVPMESVEAYKSAEWWSEYEDAIVGYDFDRNEEVVQPEQPEEIPNNHIWYTSTDGKIVEPYSGENNEYADAITTFGVNIVSNTYFDGKGIIEFEGDVTIIGGYAFYGCSNLTSVTIPGSVTTIERSTFRDCSSLTSVTIPDSVTTIGDYAFRNCSSLTSLTIGDGVTTIEGYAFRGCSSLTSITIPNSVTEIEWYAFYDCSSLQEFNGKFASEDGRCLIIDGTLNSFAPAGLTEYTIPDSVATIGWSAFGNCSSLTSVTIPDSVTEIEWYAFDRCSSLTSVYCKAVTPPAGGSLMFSYNASSRKIYVPMESVEAYKSANGWSNYADAIVGYNF